MKSNYSRFVSSLEIVYSLFLAVGISTLLMNAHWDIQYFLLVTICILTLIRFFFAPSKNIECVLLNISKSSISVEMQNNQYRNVMLIDVPILFLHAAIFMLMCANAGKSHSYVYFFWAFAFLLILNSFWLIYISHRMDNIKRKCAYNTEFWMRNNMWHALFIALFIIIIQYGYFLYFLINNFDFYIYIISWFMLYLLSFSNCIIDLYKTFRTYLFD